MRFLLHVTQWTPCRLFDKDNLRWIYINRTFCNKLYLQNIIIYFILMQKFFNLHFRSCTSFNTVRFCERHSYTNSTYPKGALKKSIQPPLSWLLENKLFYHLVGWIPTCHLFLLFFIFFISWGGDGKEKNKRLLYKSWHDHDSSLYLYFLKYRLLSWIFSRIVLNYWYDIFYY